MRPNRLRAVWQENRYALNAWLSIGSSYAAEVMAHLPYDSITVDLQHGMLDFETAVGMLQAISSSDAVPLVRVPVNQSWFVQKLLDAGAYGVICPMIDTAEECAAFVRATKYPPAGERSFGPSRGLLYGGRDYAAAANETVMSWAMIETARGLDNLEAIAATPGLDGLYIGPSDLSMTLEGVVASPLSPLVTRHVERIIQVGKANGLKVGIFCPDVAFARQMIALQCDLVTVLNDAGLLRQATAAIVKELRQPV